jgi:glycerol-3-phosphate acyltransferase PlsY
MDILFYALLIVGSYLIGAIPFGFLIGKLYGVDVRKVGSCNIGATNVTRTVGKIPGKICFVLDFLKGALPALAAKLLYSQESWLIFTCCALAVLGHIFPVYLKFKGGKGVSTAAGATLVLAPLPLLGAVLVWVTGFLLWRYVSLASILAAVSLPVLAGVFMYFEKASRDTFTLVFLSIMALVAVLRHTGNIRRLLAGTESRFDKSGGQQKSPAGEEQISAEEPSQNREE